MARKVTHAAAALALLAALPALAACAVPEPSAAGVLDNLPSFGRAPPRMRAPSAERPVWLAPPPSDPQRLPAPEHGFRAQGGARPEAEAPSGAGAEHRIGAPLPG